MKMFWIHDKYGYYDFLPSRLYNNESVDCPRPCTEHLYKIRPFNFMESSNTTVLSLTAISTQVDVSTQIVLFDENSVISSVGGSLGIFVGFSFFGCVMAAYKIICAHKLK